ncbi:hypothetical protein V1498_19160 [Peribacillus sp. SCS-26]|uniref:hypothetical protein n=1 Tax=Paraperibacillus marinus TaxID=3115295 RepID=UPI003906A267
MTIVIICVLAAVFLVFLLVRVNSRALSSPVEKSAGHGDAAAMEAPARLEAAAGEGNGNIAADDRQTETDVHASRELAVKMKDAAYRQTLKNFKKPASQQEKQPYRETGIDDTQYRKALSNIKNKKN